VSAKGQCVTRSTLATRGNKGGFEALELICNTGFSAVWDAALDVTLNGTDVSALGVAKMHYPRSELPVAMNVSQGTAGNQPLYTGAPAYNGSPTIQFTAANNDELDRANTDLAGTGPITMIFAAKMTVNGSIFANTVGLGSGFTLRTDNRSFQGLGGGARTFAVNGALDTTTPHVVLFAVDAQQQNAYCFIDNVAQVLTISGTIAAAPGATASVRIGSIIGTLSVSMDYIFGCWAKRYLPQSIGYRICNTLMRRAGIIS